MALPSSGPLSLLQIATEFGGSAPHSLNEYYAAAPGVPTSGPISISHFYGKSKGFVFTRTISADTSNYNLRAQAVAAGWDQALPLLADITVASGVVVSANATSAYAFDTGSSFPAGSSLKLTNNGYIIGMGGQGANGYINGSTRQDGYPGGPALFARAALTVTNNGVIGGGGGGGGGGANNEAYGYGGGGGRSGRTASVGGYSGGLYPADPGTFDSGGRGRNGGLGGTTGAGGGAASNGPGGGGGGGWGASGGRGATNPGYGGYGGAGGAAVNGNANITWAALGTRLGAVT